MSYKALIAGGIISVFLHLWMLGIFPAGTPRVVKSDPVPPPVTVEHSDASKPRKTEDDKSDEELAKKLEEQLKKQQEAFDAKLQQMEENVRKEQEQKQQQLEAIAKKSKQNEQKLQEAQALAEQAKAEARQAEAQAKQAEAQVKQAEAQAEQARRDAEQKARDEELKRQLAQIEIDKQRVALAKEQQRIERERAAAAEARKQAERTGQERLAKQEQEARLAAERAIAAAEAKKRAEALAARAGKEDGDPDGQPGGDPDGDLVPVLRIGWGDSEKAMQIVREANMRLVLQRDRKPVAEVYYDRGWKTRPYSTPPGYSDLSRNVHRIGAFAPVVNALDPEPGLELNVLFPSHLERHLQSVQLATAADRGLELSQIKAIGGVFRVGNRGVQFSVMIVQER